LRLDATTCSFFGRLDVALNNAGMDREQRLKTAVEHKVG